MLVGPSVTILSQFKQAGSTTISAISSSLRNFRKDFGQTENCNFRESSNIKFTGKISRAYFLEISILKFC